MFSSSNKILKLSRIYLLTHSLLLPVSLFLFRILTAMISGGNSLGIKDEDIRFTTIVLNDAKRLDWKRGELHKREMAVKGIFMGRLSEAWKEDEQGYGMNAKKRPSARRNNDSVDPLFQKKNWNQIDSGFRLWGGGNYEVDGTGSIAGGRGGSSKRTVKNNNGETVDEFLESKNWNDIDSSFRIL